MLKTVMAFDFGTRVIGSAIGQEVTFTASPLKAFRARNGHPNWGELSKQVKEWMPNLIVVGLPVDTRGKDLGDITLKARKFSGRVSKLFKVNVELHEEHFSTTEARDRIFSQGGFKALEKGAIDCQSAVVILESWFGIRKKIIYP